MCPRARARTGARAGPGRVRAAAGRTVTPATLRLRLVEPEGLGSRVTVPGAPPGPASQDPVPGRRFFWKAYLSIKQPLTAHDPTHPQVSSRPVAVAPGQGRARRRGLVFSSQCDPGTVPLRFPSVRFKKASSSLREFVCSPSLGTRRPVWRARARVPMAAGPPGPAGPTAAAKARCIPRCEAASRGSLRWIGWLGARGWGLASLSQCAAPTSNVRWKVHCPVAA